MTTIHSLRDMERLAIDEELANGSVRSDEAIRILKAQRNKLAPIAIIPDDILVHIFLLVRHIAISFADKWHWQYVAHICSHWRRVAIGLPALWTKIDHTSYAFCRSYPFTLLMLERSQNAPLHVTLSNPQTPVLKAILGEIERIQSICLESPRRPEEFLTEIKAILGDRRGLALQNISLRSNNDHLVDNADKVLLEVFRPPPQIFRKLELWGATYNWAFLGTMPYLTHLDLWDGHPSPAITCTGAAFLDALRCLTNLEELSFSGENMQYGMTDFPPTPRPPPVHLPRLRYLNVDDGCQVHVDGFLALTTLPALSDLNIEDTREITNPQGHVQSVFSLLGTAAFPRLEFLHIEYDTDSFLMTLSAAHWDRYDKPHRMHLMFSEESLIASGQAAPGESSGTSACTAVNIMSWIKPYIQTNGNVVVRHLRLQDDSETLSAPDFVREFGHLLHLESVDVNDSEAMVLFEALSCNAAAMGHESDTQPLFPKLSSISWRGRYPAEEHQETCFNHGKFITAYNCLVARRQCGVPIARLDLAECPVLNNHQSKCLAELGVEVKGRSDCTLLLPSDNVVKTAL